MLEQPDLPDDKIIACLRANYALRIIQVTFLPLGADQNTVVYRVVAADETPYFLKLRRGVFDETSVALPGFLHDQGIRHIIAPLTTRAGQLRAYLDDYAVIMYPFIVGRDGYDVDLSDHHWIEFGAALKRLHTANVPPSITSRIPRENYSAQWRDLVKMFLARIEVEIFDDPVAAQTAAFLRTKHDEVLAFVARTERLAEALQASPRDYVVCHADLHAGNMFMADSALYIVDWDTALLAPKERDLMFVGGGQFGDARTAHEEEALFYRGYGPTQIDPVAIAYYRYARIIEDIAVECQLIFSTIDSGEDRARELRFLMSNFEPNGVLAIAHRSDRA